jgi:HAD superfamily hydrolase (TIGR01459 family)
MTVIASLVPPASLPDQAPPRVVAHIAPQAGNFDVVLCDVWGILHNGLTAWPAASDALMRWRGLGATVVLVSNAPRPGEVVARQLDRMGVPRRAYDTIVTSGDVTRAEMQERGGICYHLGPPRDDALFDGVAARRGPLEDASYIVCTGLVHENRETAEDYRPLLEVALARGLDFVCANPDLVVEVGDRLVPCAGAIADLYVRMGGPTLYAGKPHPPIYERALAAAARIRGGATAHERVIGIGDSLRTDVAGARAMGVTALFVASGIHGEAVLDKGGHLDQVALAALFAEGGLWPDLVQRGLAW